MVYSQSEILAQSVYLVEKINTESKEKMSHMKAICFLRPTQDSLDALCKELKEPRYGNYYIYFSNILRSSQLERLADADENEVIREVQEYYGDFYALTPEVFSINVSGVIGSTANIWNPDALDRSVEGVISLLLALKKRPVIRYPKTSSLCKQLADRVSESIRNEGQLFDFRRTDTPPMLLLLDRRDDPVTPLLNQWRYIAMVHELLGIHNNRVDLSQVPNIRKDMKEIVMSCEQDEFYKKNMWSNFGEIGGAIKALVDQFQEKTKSNANIESIEDMKQFIENYPQFRQMSGTVAKHVTVVGELSRLVNERFLLEVSEIEQSIVTANAHQAHIQSINGLVDQTRVPNFELLRLVLLYALRYETQTANQIPQFLNALTRRNLPEAEISLVGSLMQYAGASVRSVDLFGDRDLVNKGKKIFKGLKGVENLYTQHEPLVQDILDQLIKGKLKEVDYPFHGNSLRDRPQDIIVFVVGGATYEEAYFINKLNQTVPGVRIVLGGTNLYNTEGFLDEVERCVANMSRHSGAAGRRHR
eukprot:Colp12_sorted_trinity150504_noHs@13588